MSAGGGSYGSKQLGGQVASTLKRQAAQRVSYNNTKLRPRSQAGNGKFAHVKPLPKP